MERLSVDSTTLNSSITSNFQDFVNFFQNSSSTGFAQNFSNDLNTMLSPSGLIASDENGISRERPVALRPDFAVSVQPDRYRAGVTYNGVQPDRRDLEQLPTLELQVQGEFEI